MALGRGHSWATSWTLGGVVGAAAGVAELCLRAVLLGDFHWAPPDPGREIALAACVSAALYALPGIAIGALAHRWLTRSPRLSAALAASVPVVAFVAIGLAWIRHQPVERLSDAAAPSGVPSVLLVTLDTTRTDALGAYGNRHARTPTLDALASEGVRFDDATVQSILTGPSHASILTGLGPQRHGVTENSLALDARVPTLADTLGKAGFATAAFVSGGPVKQSGLQVLSRFDQYSDDFRRHRRIPYLAFETLLGRRLGIWIENHVEPLEPPRREARWTTDDAIDWFEQGGERPFFAWVHYFDAHLPYQPPERLLGPEAKAYRGPAKGRWYQLGVAQRRAIIESPAAMEQMRRLYDASVTSMDEQLARLVLAARARATPAGLWIVITADHGEGFGEHEKWFERDLYQDTIHVPLIVVPPRERGPWNDLARGRTVEVPVRSIDIAPTLYEVLGLPVPELVEGVSLLGCLRADGASHPPPGYAAIYPTRGTPRDDVRVALRSGRWKAIWNLAIADGQLGGFELYDVDKDPAERHNRAASSAEHMDALRTQMDPAVLAPRPVQELLAPRDLRMLRELGYAQ